MKHWLLVVFKSVQVGGVGTALPVHRPIAPVIFSHPLTHCPSQKIMEGIFLCLGCRSPNLSVLTYSLRLITVRFLCQGPQGVQILDHWCWWYRRFVVVPRALFPSPPHTVGRAGRGCATCSILIRGDARSVSSGPGNVHQGREYTRRREHSVCRCVVSSIFLCMS